MWKIIKQVIQDTLTEDDGISWCWAKMASTSGIFAYLMNSAYILVHTGNLSLTDFATGFATLLAGSGAVIAAKQATQRKL